MPRIRYLHGLDDEAPCDPEVKVPDRHALNLVKRASAASLEGDAQRTITELGHAVYAAAFDGPQGVSQHEMILALRQVAGFGFPWDDPDRAA